MRGLGMPEIAAPGGIVAGAVGARQHREPHVEIHEEKLRADAIRILHQMPRFGDELPRLRSGIRHAAWIPLPGKGFR